MYRRAAIPPGADTLPPGEPGAGQQRIVRRSLHYALLEGSTGGIVQRIIDSFFTPFALVLQATTGQIGLLAAIPSFVGATSQLSTPFLVGVAGSRKRLILLVVLAGALMWVPIAFLPWLFGKQAVLPFLVLATLVVMLQQLPSPAWGSWIPQLMPMKGLGTYMARRSMLALLLSAIVAMSVARWLDIMSAHIYLAFMVLFLVAGAVRLGSFLLFLPVHEPALPDKPSSRVGLVKFLRTLPSTNVGRFMGYTMAMSFATNVAGPFFTMFMLNDLHFTYTKVMTLQMVSLGAYVVGLRIWGHSADRRGNLLVVRMTAPLASILPLLWLVRQDFWWLVVIECVGSIGWSGWQLCAVNFIYESSRPEDRARTVAYFNALNGTGVLIGALLGGFLAPHLPQLFAYGIMSLFLVSGVLRLSSAVFLLPLIKEVRESPQALLRRRLPFFRESVVSAYGWRPRDADDHKLEK